MVMAVMWVAALAAPGRAHAQASAADKAAAEALFDEGRQLMDAKSYDAACSKFEGSQRLAAGIGTLLYLADCYEKSGRVASAWATFREASSKAAAAGQQDRARIASERAGALEPKLSRLRIRVAAEVPGLEVKRNGTAVGRDIWGAPVPVDPGSYQIEARATNKAPWSIRYDVPAQAGTFEVVVPALDDAPAGSAAAAAPAIPPGAATPGTGGDAGAARSSRGDAQRIAALVVGGLGVVGLGIGVGFTASAVSKDSEADDHCDGTTCRDAEGQVLSEDARAAGNVATVALAVGAAAVAGGVVLYLTAPRGPEAAPTTGRDAAPRGQVARRDVWIRADARGVVTCGGTW
jgi:serine/threonine-protein kinase